jgi:hypothetical protein
MKCKMKKYISAILIDTLLLQFVGCYSYSALTKEEINEGRPYSDESIILVLSDGSEVSCSAALGADSNEFYYLKIDRPSRILIGSGDKINKDTGVKSSFKGMISGEMIDSSRIIIVDNEEYAVYWTKDYNRLSFMKGEFIDILPEQGTGYYICKAYKLERIITFDEIKEIQESSINWYVMGPYTVVSVAAIIVLGIAISRAEFPHN